jgi:hypothetical protein
MIEFTCPIISCRAQKAVTASDKAAANTKMSFTGRDALEVFENWEELVSVCVKDKNKLRQWYWKSTNLFPRDL